MQAWMWLAPPGVGRRNAGAGTFRADGGAIRPPILQAALPGEGAAKGGWRAEGSRPGLVRAQLIGSQ